MFKLYVQFLDDAGLLGKTTVGVDGSKFKAVNSKKNNYNQNKIDKHRRFIEDKTAKYLQELDELDKAESTGAAQDVQLQKEKIAGGLKKLKERTLKYDVLQERLNQTEDKQISTTDPDSRSIIAESIVEVAYNTQNAVDDKHNLIVHTEATNTNDGKALGLAKYWSGTAQQAKKGLEAGCLAIIDVEDRTAYSLEGVQTPVPGEEGSLVKHYTNLITERATDILKYTDVLTVDGYFFKEGFVSAVTGGGLQVITKARGDANMRYLYKGPQRNGPGRKKTYAGKVAWPAIDKRRWKVCYQDDDVTAYEAVVWSVALKRRVKAVYVKAKEHEGSAVLVCSDTQMAGETVLRCYRLRFQIEFLIRDAKTHAGLEHCQARSEEKLYNHFNMAMLSVSVVKLQTWAQRPDKAQVPFSLRSIKTFCMNQYLTETIFTNLALDMSCQKIKRLYNQCLNIGSRDA